MEGEKERRGGVRREGYGPFSDTLGVMRTLDSLQYWLPIAYHTYGDININGVIGTLMEV